MSTPSPSIRQQLRTFSSTWTQPSSCKEIWTAGSPNEQNGNVASAFRYRLYKVDSGFFSCEAPDYFQYYNGQPYFANWQAGNANCPAQWSAAYTITEISDVTATGVVCCTSGYTLSDKGICVSSYTTYLTAINDQITASPQLTTLGPGNKYIKPLTLWRVSGQTPSTSTSDMSSTTSTSTSAFPTITGATTEGTGGPTATGQPSSGLSGGAKGGIAAAAVIAGLILIGLLLFWLRRKAKSRQAQRFSAASTGLAEGGYKHGYGYNPHLSAELDGSTPVLNRPYELPDRHPTA